MAGVVVATSTGAHAAMVEALLDRDIPLYVEKPLTDDVAAARRIVERAGERVFVMDKWRYHEGIQALKRIAVDQELGGVRGLRATRVSWGNAHLDTDVVWTLAPHDLAIYQEIVGPLPPPRAALEHRVGGELAGLFGLLGHDPWLALEVSAQHEKRRETRLHCDRGVAILAGGYADHVKILRSDGSVGEPVIERRVISQAMPLLEELRAFVAHLNGGPPPRSSADDGLAVVETLAALRRMASGTP